MCLKNCQIKFFCIAIRPFQRNAILHLLFEDLMIGWLVAKLNQLYFVEQIHYQFFAMLLSLLSQLLVFLLLLQLLLISLLLLQLSLPPQPLVFLLLLLQLFLPPQLLIFLFLLFLFQLLLISFLSLLNLEEEKLTVAFSSG